MLTLLIDFGKCELAKLFEVAGFVRKMGGGNVVFFFLAKTRKRRGEERIIRF